MPEAELANSANREKKRTSWWELLTAQRIARQFSEEPAIRVTRSRYGFEVSRLRAALLIAHRFAFVMGTPLRVRVCDDVSD